MLPPTTASCSASTASATPTSEVVGLGHVVLHVGGSVELFLTSGAEHTNLRLRLRRDGRRADSAGRADGSG